MTREEAWQKATELGGVARLAYRSRSGWVLVDWGKTAVWVVVSKDNTKILAS